MNLINELVRGIWLMDKPYAESYYPIALKMLLGNVDFNAPKPNANKRFADQCRFSVIADGKPEQYNPIASFRPRSANDAITPRDLFYNESHIAEGSVFMIAMVGPITKYSQLCGPEGMQEKAQWLKMADASSKISAHLIIIDSGGGEAMAMNYMAETLKNLTKEVFIFIDGMAASAAYGIAAHGANICASSDLDMVGSIGTYSTIIDMEEYYEKQGIKILTEYATKSTDKNKIWRDALEGKRELWKKDIDTFNEKFLSMVKQMRSEQLTQDETVWGTGKMFYAREAVEIGLIDNVLTLDQYLIEIHSNPK